MLEALVALSLASSIVQFVDFASALLSEGRQIRHAGSTVTNLDLQAICRDLERLSLKLSTSVTPSSEDSGEDEQALADLAASCKAIADDILQCLQQLTHSPNSQKWQSTRQALNLRWKKDKIDAMVSRIKNYRDQLQFRILVDLRSSIGAFAIHQDERYAVLDDSTKSSIQAILECRKVFKNDLITHTQRLTYRQNQSDAMIKYYHDETLSAIEGLQSQSSLNLGRRHDPNTEARKQVKLLEKRKKVLSTVLEVIGFPLMGAREETIPSAHQSTFEWILREADSEHGSWTNFIWWLREGAGCYWINGKAGSGKSTLMKYMAHASETRRHLSAWSGNDKFVMASFFFWNSGTWLQKSQAGLLRSLLYTLLQSCDDLLPICLPSWHAAASRGKLDSKQTLTLTELKAAFLKAVESRAVTRHFCFFIDGIDEFEGDHAELSEFFKSVARSPWLKVILSSRPIPACMDVLHECANLRLQDLTHNDIENYVYDMIGKHRRIKELQYEQQEETSNLVSEIVEKASGVFLWVTLVVKSLLDGLRNFDTIQDLRQRLDDTPEELRDLYKHMISCMEPLYRRQASEIFQIVYRYYEVAGTDKERSQIATIQLAQATETKPRDAIRAVIEPLSIRRKKLRCIAMEGRLRSRCCGLLEVHHLTSNSYYSDTRYESQVSFFHRTVLDFLKEEQTWQYLLSLTEKEHFDPNVAILASCLLRAKTSEVEILFKSQSNAVVDSLQDGMKYARLAEESQRQPQTAYVDELALVWIYHERAYGRLLAEAKYLTEVSLDYTHGEPTAHLCLENRSYYADRCSNHADIAFTCLCGFFSPHPTFISLAVHSNLTLYVRDKVLDNMTEIMEDWLYPLRQQLFTDLVVQNQYAWLLQQSIELVFDPFIPSKTRSSYEAFIIALVQEGADVNKGYKTLEASTPDPVVESGPVLDCDDDSIWVTLLRCVDEWMTNDNWTIQARMEMVDTLSNIMDVFMSNKADPHASYSLDGGTRHALSVFQQSLSPSLSQRPLWSLRQLVQLRRLQDRLQRYATNEPLYPPFEITVENPNFHYGTLRKKKRHSKGVPASPRSSSIYTARLGLDNTPVPASPSSSPLSIPPAAESDPGTTRKFAFQGNSGVLPLSEPVKAAVDCGRDIGLAHFTSALDEKWSFPPEPNVQDRRLQTFPSFAPQITPDARVVFFLLQRGLSSQRRAKAPETSYSSLQIVRWLLSQARKRRIEDEWDWGHMAHS